TRWAGGGRRRCPRSARPPGGPSNGSPPPARPPREEALRHSLPPAVDRSASLSSAMGDALLSPGKRLRPLVALAAGDLARARRAAALTVAVAVEYVHAASLVLDDLPSMDDARRPRARPPLPLTPGP